jgi:UDP-2,3-diacylglucosamine pyrophosphatase LpxH
MNTARNKIIFISDLHMNDHFSFSPGGNGYSHAYTWLNENIPKVAAFLNWLRDRSDVAELIILGDLFDGWLCPMHHVPTSDFMDIVTASENAPIIDALKILCKTSSGITVSYAPGNHDMLIDNIFIPANGFESLNFLNTAPGMGVYRKDDVLIAEHGSRFCLFNAPDTWSHPDSHLPEGFFMTRVAAEYAAAGGIVLDLSEVLQSFMKKGIQETLPRDFLNTIIAGAIRTEDMFLMNGLDGFSPDPTCADVLEYYAAICREWGKRQDVVPTLTSITDDLGTLVPAAYWSFLTGKPYSPKILIFGHTHNFGLHGFHSILGREEASSCKEYTHIYANTGAWIDRKTCTYIEVEDNGSEGSYCVRGYSFEDAQHQTLRDEGFIKIEP